MENPYKTTSLRPAITFVVRSWQFSDVIEWDRYGWDHNAVSICPRIHFTKTNTFCLLYIGRPSEHLFFFFRENRPWKGFASNGRAKAARLPAINCPLSGRLRDRPWNHRIEFQFFERNKGLFPMMLLDMLRCSSLGHRFALSIFPRGL